MEIFERRAVGPLACNCYVVGDPAAAEAVVIDPGGDADDIAASIAQRGLTVAAIVATHAHFDHILGAARLRELTGAAVYLHPADAPLLDWMRESGRMFLGTDVGPPPEIDGRATEGDCFDAGTVSLEVVHTPGHSPGSIALVAPGAVFAGDTLFAGSVGRTDLPGGDTRALLAAVRAKLFELDDDVEVHPGHGPSTTIGRERASNPFVGDGAAGWAG